MGAQNDIAIIVQARTGSSRLANKMLLPIHNGKTILEIIISNLLIYFEPDQIIVATTTNENDTQIELLANKLKVKCFRGSEIDVLERFIKAAEHFKVNNIIRICADNPLLQASYVKELANEFSNRKSDYLSFAFSDGTPVIRSHIGLFSEATTVEALKKVQRLTADMLYREHVTNYIYTHPNDFSVEFLSLPVELENKKEIRLTIDTKEDFSNVREIIEANCSDTSYEISISRILNYINKNDHLLKSMAHEIERNSK